VGAGNWRLVWAVEVGRPSVSLLSLLLSFISGRHARRGDDPSYRKIGVADPSVSLGRYFLIGWLRIVAIHRSALRSVSEGDFPMMRKWPDSPERSKSQALPGTRLCPTLGDIRNSAVKKVTSVYCNLIIFSQVNSKYNTFIFALLNSTYKYFHIALPCYPKSSRFGKK